MSVPTNDKERPLSPDLNSDLKSANDIEFVANMWHRVNVAENEVRI